MGEYTSKAFRERNKPMEKMTKASLEVAITASERIHAESTAIRARVGLPPVPESIALVLARMRMGEFKTPPAKSSVLPDAKIRRRSTSLRALSDRFKAQMEGASALISGDPLLRAYRGETTDWIVDIGAELERAAAYMKEVD